MNAPRIVWVMVLAGDPVEQMVDRLLDLTAEALSGDQSLALLRRLASRQEESYAFKLLATMRNQFGGHAVKGKE